MQVQRNVSFAPFLFGAEASPRPAALPCGPHALRPSFSHSANLVLPGSVGHEIVGTVVRAGSKSGHVLGARVGVGAQAGSCGSCKLCLNEREVRCKIK